MSNLKVKGVTVIELLIALLMTGILMAYAIPSFKDFTRAQRVSNETNDMISDLTYARVAALNSGLDVIVEPLDPGNWSDGWRIYSDIDGSGTYDAASDELLRENAKNPKGLAIGGVNNIGFDNQGALLDSVVAKELTIKHDGSPVNKVISVALSGLINSKSGS